MALALKHAQAEAIYNALCLLNNVNASLEDSVIRLPGKVSFSLYAQVHGGGYAVNVDGRAVEEYATADEFIGAYKL